jgi:hypothetical protein
MTTCLYDRREKIIVADTQNTDRVGAIYRTHKIERLKDGRYFLGSGHCHTIGLMRRWAEKKFAETARPECGVLLSDVDEYAATCLVISEDGEEVWLVDDEMEPMVIDDYYIAIGSGASYAMGALDAGASACAAVAIAANRDPSTSAPYDIVRLAGEPA